MFGEYGLARPVVARWTLDSFPEAVTVGRTVFKKAVWRQPYDGVVEQYREDVERNSAHLMVYANGLFRIGHVDEDNPDRGRPLQHFFNDHPVGKAMKEHPAVTAGIAVAACVALVALLRG